MLGVDIKETVAVGKGTINRFGVGFMWRWRSRTPRMDDRLAFAYRLGSYRTLVSSPVLGQTRSGRRAPPPAHGRRRIQDAARQMDMVGRHDGGMNRRVSFMIESSYNYSRPLLTVRSGGVDVSRRLNADALVFKAGVVYGIW